MGGRSRGPSGPSPEQQRQIQEQEQRIAQQQEQLTRQESELAARTSASLRARRGRGRALLLGTDEDQSTLG